MSNDSAASRDLKLAVLLIAVLTVWRLTALAFDATDLWVDEAQYWLWGQSLDWGYFSKPPMIAWLSRAVTDLAGSDAIFWIRAPGAVLHAVTAALLGATAARLFDARTGAWAALFYATAPFATLGSWQFSTDTVMLPFYAAALYALVRLTESRSLGWAVALGVATGLGFLSKYAMIYLPLTAVVAAVATPRARIAVRDAGMAAAVALIVVSPNLVWNLTNGGQTIKHVASDNAKLGEGAVDPLRAIAFLLEQFAVFGPVLFAAWAAASARAVVKGPPALRMLAWLSWPTLILIAVQAARAQAHANWAVTAYAAASILVAAALIQRPRLRTTALGVNLVLALAFPLLFVFADRIRLPDGDLLAARYVGPRALSREIAEVAQGAGAPTIVARERGVLADLFHTLRDSGIALYALPPGGEIDNFYEASFPLPVDAAGPVLFVTGGTAPDCAGPPVQTIRPDDGIYAGRAFSLYVTDTACLAGLGLSSGQALR